MDNLFIWFGTRSSASFLPSYAHYRTSFSAVVVSNAHFYFISARNVFINFSYSHSFVSEMHSVLGGRSASWKTAQCSLDYLYSLFRGFAISLSLSILTLYNQLFFPTRGNEVGAAGRAETRESSYHQFGTMSWFTNFEANLYSIQFFYLQFFFPPFYRLYSPLNRM